MQRIGIIAILALLSGSIPCAAVADDEGDSFAAFSLGSARAKASGFGVKNLRTENRFSNCAPRPDDQGCEAASSLRGTFLGFELGGSAKKRPLDRYQFMVDFLFLPDQSYAAGLWYTQIFLDANCAYLPIRTKYAELKVIGGMGAAITSFNANSKHYSYSPHMQFHTGIGVELYVTKHIFVRPQFDFRYIVDFTDQFGSNTAAGSMIWVGYRK
jgi:hypothetical protein